MASIRQEKVASVLQKEIAELFRESSTYLQGAMLTITKVRMTPDMGLAKVYLSIFNAPDKKVVMSWLKTNQKEFRRALGQRVRHQLRKVPELMFIEDDSLDYLDEIDRLLKK